MPPISIDLIQAFDTTDVFILLQHVYQLVSLSAIQHAIASPL
jgi:hypothetical protein